MVKVNVQRLLHFRYGCCDCSCCTAVFRTVGLGLICMQHSCTLSSIEEWQQRLLEVQKPLFGMFDYAPNCQHTISIAAIPHGLQLQAGNVCALVM